MKSPTFRKGLFLIALVLALTLGAASQVAGLSTLPAPGAQAADNCIACHTNAGILQSLAAEEPLDQPQGETCKGQSPSMEAWERVYVQDAEFLDSVHNAQGCIACHGGVQGEMNMAAHEGLVSDADQTCGNCHTSEAKMAPTGLHQTLQGFYSALEQRGADFDDPLMQQAFDQNCANCHSSCGQCHVSRPDFAGGGLIAGHEIVEIVPEQPICAGCHGGRVTAEYIGQGEDAPGSVHWSEAGMACNACHDGDKLHGDDSAGARANRYDGSSTPRCLDCHSTASPDQSDILQHELHWNVVSCDVCHVSGPYQNCFNCHVEADEAGASYCASESEMMFKIGRNPLQSEERPWEYVLLRHVPIEPDTFKDYGNALLPNFDAAPTWKYTTPHNIQRITPQNETCNNCHGNEDLFLTADDVREARWEANAGVMVEQVPANTERLWSSAQGTDNATCLKCHGVPDMTLELASGETVWLSIDAETFNASVHGNAGYACVQCHTDITGYPHPEVTAQTRREYVMQRYTACVDCHQDQYDAILDSVHQKALAGGNLEAAVCTDCHGVHNVGYFVEPRSETTHVCERCHSQIYKLYESSAHGAALLGEGNPDVPTCTDCHGIHSVEGPSETGFHLFSPRICEKCHANPELMGRYDISTDVFETYVADFHGTTVVLFEETAPDQETNKPVCIDCHGVHNMRSPDDQESTVIKENLLKTCQRCHPDATTNFPDSWLSHYQPDLENSPLVYSVNMFYYILIPAVIGAMIVFNLADVRRRLAQRGKKEDHHYE